MAEGGADAMRSADCQASRVTTRCVLQQAPVGRPRARPNVRAGVPGMQTRAGTAGPGQLLATRPANTPRAAARRAKEAPPMRPIPESCKVR